MRRLRSMLLALPLLGLAPGCVLAADVQPVNYGYGYGYGYARPYYPPPRYYAPVPVYRPYYPPPRHYGHGWGGHHGHGHGWHGRGHHGGGHHGGGHHGGGNNRRGWR